MNEPVSATVAETRETGARYAWLPTRAFAVFIALHGTVHVVGFTVPWGLGGPRGVEYSTQLLNRSIEVGDTAVKLVGVVWLAAAIAFVVVAVMLWLGHPLALRATVGLLGASLVLCTLGLPGAVMGLAVDVVALGLLAIASDRLIARRVGAVAGTARSGRGRAVR